MKKALLYLICAILVISAAFNVALLMQINGLKTDLTELSDENYRILTDLSMLEDENHRLLTEAVAQE